jgi:hypothetical protein
LEAILRLRDPGSVWVLIRKAGRTASDQCIPSWSERAVRIDSGVASKMGETIPKGSAGIIILVNHPDGEAVKGVLGNSLKVNCVSVEGDGISELKEVLALANVG